MADRLGDCVFPKVNEIKGMSCALWDEVVYILPLRTIGSSLKIISQPEAGKNIGI